MLYLISGASRSGKTIIANTILKQKQLPYMSLDWLVMGFTNGIPQYGINDKLFPDEIAQKFWSFLKAMCKSMLWADVDYVLEGEAIHPELVRELLDRYPGKIKICFLGYTDIDIEKKIRDIKTYNDGAGDWLVKKSDDYIYSHITNMVMYSRKIKKLCGKNDIAYFDTSADFNPALKEATQYLLSESTV